MKNFFEIPIPLGSDAVCVVLGMDQIGQSHDPSVIFLDTDLKHMSAEWGFAYTKCASQNGLKNKVYKVIYRKYISVQNIDKQQKKKKLKIFLFNFLNFQKKINFENKIPK